MSDDPGGSGDESFAQRLASARTRRGLDAPAGAPPSDKGGGNSAMGVGLRMGAELVSALAVGLVIGWALDYWLHTRPIFLAIFVLLGGVAGTLNVFRTVGRAPGRN